MTLLRPQYLGPGRKGLDCLAYALKHPVPLGVEAWRLWTEICALGEATLVGVCSPNYQYCEHVMRVVRQDGPLEHWLVESKLGRRGECYRHCAGDVLATGCFLLDRRDPTWQPNISFPGYSGILVPLRSLPPP